jgi:hypothetical protein
VRRIKDRWCPRPHRVRERRRRERARPAGSRSMVTFRSRRALQRRDRLRLASSPVQAVPRHRKALGPHSGPAVPDRARDRRKQKDQDRLRRRVKGRGPNPARRLDREHLADLEGQSDREAQQREPLKALALRRDQVPEAASRARGRSRRRPAAEAAVQVPGPDQHRDPGQEPGSRAAGQAREGRAPAERPASPQRSGQGRSGSPHRERALLSLRTTRP